MSPQETKKVGGICPQCGGKLTVGVLSRVEELADRPEGFKPQGAIPYKSLVPLAEIIAEVLGVQSRTKKVEEQYQKLINHFSNEFTVLLDADLDEMKKVVDLEIAQGIERARKGDLIIEPGYDGEYGKIRLFKEEKETAKPQDQLF